jgi:drug/metabolite transporter (DMT)-like permease
MSSPAPKPAVVETDWAGYGFAILGAMFFSAKGIFVKLGFIAGATAEQMLAIRMMVALPVYLAVGIALFTLGKVDKQALSPRLVIEIIAIGALGYFLASYLDFEALNYISVQYGRLVLFTYPFFTIILGAMFFGDTFNPRLLWPLMCSYLGIATLFAWNLQINPDGLVRGTLLVMSAALAFALYQLLAKRRIQLIGSLLFTCIGMSAAALVAISHAAYRGELVIEAFNPSVVWNGVALGVIATVLPSFMLSEAIGRVGPKVTSTMGTLGPVVTIVLAIFLLGEPFTVFHAIGTILVIAGAFWFGRANR